MQEENTYPTKRYMSTPIVFADMLNGFLYDGAQVIDPKDLKPVDPIDCYSSEIKSESFYDQMCIMMGSGKIYAVYCIEDQSQIDRSLIVNMRIHDAARYCKELASSDYAQPIIHLIVNFDSKPWNHPVSLYELLDEENRNSSVLGFISDYKINLYDPHTIEDFTVFRTGLKQVFQCVRAGQSKAQLEKVTKNFDE